MPLGDCFCHTKSLHTGSPLVKPNTLLSFKHSFHSWLLFCKITWWALPCLPLGHGHISSCSIDSPKAISSVNTSSHLEAILLRTPFYFTLHFYGMASVYPVCQLLCIFYSLCQSKISLWTGKGVFAFIVLLTLALIPCLTQSELF